MWTGIPVFKLTEAETKKLIRMEEELHKRVIGQDVAIEAVSKAIRRSRAGIKDPKRPAGSFIFLGPSGVGKTELARTLAEFLFGDEDSMVRIDMSEYMEKHAVSRLVGSPPGYVGYDEGGQLTEAVRRKPYSVLLLDEIEKAHPDVFNILLQILEDGRLTDAQGRTVDFRNTIVIMTSNIGAKDIARNVSFGFAISDDETGASYEDMKERIMGELKKVFRPEFLNRIDEVIVFHKLSREEVRLIIDLLIARVRAQVAEHELQLELTDAAKDVIAEKGWDPAMGARPLRRAIQRYIEDPLADEVLRQGPESIVSGTTVLVDADPRRRPRTRPSAQPEDGEAEKRAPKKDEDADKEPVGVGAKKADDDPVPTAASRGRCRAGVDSEDCRRAGAEAAGSPCALHAWRSSWRRRSGLRRASGLEPAAPSSSSTPTTSASRSETTPSAGSRTGSAVGEEASPGSGCRARVQARLSRAANRAIGGSAACPGRGDYHRRSRNGFTASARPPRSACAPPGRARHHRTSRRPGGSPTWQARSSRPPPARCATSTSSTAARSEPRRGARQPRPSRSRLSAITRSRPGPHLTRSRSPSRELRRSAPGPPPSTSEPAPPTRRSFPEPPLSLSSPASPARPVPGLRRTGSRRRQARAGGRRRRRRDRIAGGARDQRLRGVLGAGAHLWEQAGRSRAAIAGLPVAGVRRGVGVGDEVVVGRLAVGAHRRAAGAHVVAGHSA